LGPDDGLILVLQRLSPAVTPSSQWAQEAETRRRLIRAKMEFLTSLLSEAVMLAKRTSKNQVTLPKSIVQTAGAADYYDVTVQNGKIVLTPVRMQQADAVRAKLQELGIKQDDVADAIAWARQRA